MPPKKGAKPLEEDFSDVPTLPELNSLIFTMLLEFKNKDRKTEVYSKIKEEWKDKVKVITRDEIIDYGKRKQTIVEDEDIKDPKKVAKAASEKLFEQFVTARREKKDRLEKLKEEAKAQATEENPDPQPNTNPNEIDCYFHMPDYPSNYEEAAALNKFKYALNACIDIEERPAIIERKGEPEVDEEGNPIEGTEQVIMEEEEISEASKVPEEEINNQKKFLDDLKQAVKTSAKDSAIRSFVVVNKDYTHRIIEPKAAEEGGEGVEPSEEVKGYNSVEEIAKDVYQSLEKTATNLIKYQNFKRNANLIHLKAQKAHPESESRLEEHVEEPQVEEPEEIKEPSKDVGKPAEKGKPDAKGKGKAGKEKAAERSAVEPEPVIEEKTELPEETMAREWDYESYNTVVKNLPENKKSIAGLLSACVINICEELEKQEKVLEEAHEELEEDDEYKYIFDDILGEVGSSQGFAERNILSGNESVFSKSAQRSMFSSAQRSRENWNQDVVLDSKDVCSYMDD